MNPDYMARLLEGECHRRRENRIQRRIQAARFPVLKTLETFNWSWPKKIDRVHIQDHGESTDWAKEREERVL